MKKDVNYKIINHFWQESNYPGAIYQGNSRIVINLTWFVSGVAGFN